MTKNIHRQVAKMIKDGFEWNMPEEPLGEDETCIQIERHPNPTASQSIQYLNLKK